MVKQSETNYKIAVWLGLGLVMIAVFLGQNWLSHDTPPPAVPSPTRTARPTATPPPPTATPPPPTATRVALLGDAATPTAARSRQGDQLPPTPQPVSPLPTPTPAGRLACTVTAAGLNLREGPGTGYQTIATLPAGVALTALKQTADGGWRLVETADRLTGWVSSPALNCPPASTGLPVALGVTVVNAASPTPVPTETPLPTTTPPAATLSQTQWRGEYFDNPSLQGQPVLVRLDPDPLEFNWILDSPGPNIPADNFSVRWSRLVDMFDGGDFIFYAEADDGVKVYVDNQLVIDNWNTAQPITYRGEAHGLTPGLHPVTVEYFESGGYARIKVWGDKTQLSTDKWTGEYFANTDLQPPALLTRQDDTIDFDWGSGSPGSGLPDNFSVRWRRKVFFDQPGEYKFTAEVDKNDRVKIYLDDWLLADKLREEEGPVSGSFAKLQPGVHTIIVEYFDVGHHAKIKFDWARQ